MRKKIKAHPVENFLNSVGNSKYMESCSMELRSFRWEEGVAENYIFPSIRDFSNKSVLCITCPKY